MRSFSLLGLLCAASAALADGTPRLGDVLSKTANLTKFNDLVQVRPRPRPRSRRIVGDFAC